MKRWHSESNYSTQNASVFFPPILILISRLKKTTQFWNVHLIIERQSATLLWFCKKHEKNISKSYQHVHNIPDHMFFALEALARVWPYFVLLWHGSDASHPWQVPWRVVPVPVLYRKSCMELLAMKKPLKSATRESRKTKLSNQKLQKRQQRIKVILIRPTKECVFVPELRGMNAVWM